MVKTQEEWRALLSPEEFDVLYPPKKKMEKAFTGEYTDVMPPDGYFSCRGMSRHIVQALSNADSYDTSGYADPNAIYDHSSPPSFHSWGVPLSHPSMMPYQPTPYYPSAYQGGDHYHHPPYPAYHPSSHPSQSHYEGGYPSYTPQYYGGPPPAYNSYHGLPCDDYNYQPTPVTAPKPAPTVMCCYHKRGVCKKTGDCWYSHEGNDDTPCHYGVKCAAGHACLSRTALAGHNSNKSVPAWARHPSKHTRDPLAMKKGVPGPAPQRAMRMPPPPPPPVSFNKTEKAPQPPSLENETCKFCDHDQLYVQPYRAHSAHEEPTLQYRVHCMQCHGSWTPTTAQQSLPPNGGNPREPQPT